MPSESVYCFWPAGGNTESCTEDQNNLERIVFLERNTIQADFRRPNFDHEWIEYGESLGEQVTDRIRGAKIVISNKLSLREAELAHLAAGKADLHCGDGFRLRRS